MGEGFLLSNHFVYAKKMAKCILSMQIISIFKYFKFQILSKKVIIVVSDIPIQKGEKRNGKTTGLSLDGRLQGV